jgi:hypothetical protein
MKQLKSILFLLSALLSIQVVGQTHLKTKEVPLNSPFLEPEVKNFNCLNPKDQSRIYLWKNKGSMLGGESVFLLERFSSSGDRVFSKSLILPQDQEVLRMELRNEISLFIVHQNIASKKSTLLLKRFNAETGETLEEKVILSQDVKDPIQAQGRGMIFQTFEQHIASSMPINFVTAPQYRFFIEPSPDGNLFLAYLVDFSQRNLIAQAVLFNLEGQLLKRGIVPIDNHFYNYGIFPNNKGTLFILNGDKNGRIALIKFDLETRENQFLDLQASSSFRSNLILRFYSDSEVYVAATVTFQNILKGVVYTKFDFEANIISKINYHELSEGILQTADLSNSTAKIEKEDWRNYLITDFEVNQYEKITVFLEKRFIVSPAYQYQPFASWDPKEWYEKLGRVVCGSILALSFNAEDALLWEFYYPKRQENDISAGIYPSSFRHFVTDEGFINMIMPMGSTGMKAPIIYRYLILDEGNGQRQKETALMNSMKSTMMPIYTSWTNSGLWVVGRKGIIGKKSYMSQYTF